MRLEMVDVFIVTADNTDISELVRLYWHPPVGELGEVDERYVIGTAEVLSFPQKGYGNQNKEMR
jgi:hypothetical protein